MNRKKDDANTDAELYQETKINSSYTITIANYANNNNNKDKYKL